jgi:hypothetical protein
MTTIVARLFRCDQKAGVALWVAVAAPFLAIALVAGIQVENWWVHLAQVQRATDTASAAGALTYKSSKNAQTAALQAAHIAELNGLSGVASPTWNASTKTLTDGSITVVITDATGSNPTLVKVTAGQVVPAGIAAMISTNSVTIPGASTSKLAPPVTATGAGGTADEGGTGGQPCILALNGGQTGVVNDITISGHVTISTPSCTIRSNGGIGFSGNVTVTAAAYYAGGAITVNGNAAAIGGPPPGISGGLMHPLSTQLTDPYLNLTISFNQILQASLTKANAASGGSALSCNNSSCTGPSDMVCSGSKCTIQPGIYSSISMTNGADVTMAPGLYTITGNMSLSGGTLQGTGVTILMAAGSTTSPDSASTTGGTVLTLSAATSSLPTGGALTGVLFASQTNGTISFGGNSSMQLAGVMYLPNGNLSISGTPTASSGCLEVIADTIKITGNVTLATTGCSAFSLPTYGSEVNPSSMVITQAE